MCERACVRAWLTSGCAQWGEGSDVEAGCHNHHQVKDRWRMTTEKKLRKRERIDNSVNWCSHIIAHCTSWCSQKDQTHTSNISKKFLVFEGGFNETHCSFTPNSSLIPSYSTCLFKTYSQRATNVCVYLHFNALTQIYSKTHICVGGYGCHHERHRMCF